MNKSPHDETLNSRRPVRSDFARHNGISYGVRRFLTLSVLVLAVVALGVWAWGHLVSSTPGEIPTIKAEGSYKQKPDQPGGVDIPNQDVQVYHEIDGNGEQGSAKSTIEHMLPPPEQPMVNANGAQASFTATAEAPAPQVEELQPAVKAVGDGKPDPFQEQQPQTVATTATPAIPVSLMDPPTEPAKTQAVAPAPVASKPVAVASTPVVAAPAPAPQTASATPSKNQAMIQLAALPDEHAAQALAQKLQGQYKGVLGAARLHTVRADLGAKGVYYRIQSQGLPENDAKAICASIKAMKSGCLLVRP